MFTCEIYSKDQKKEFFTFSDQWKESVKSHWKDKDHSKEISDSPPSEISLMQMYFPDLEHAASMQNMDEMNSTKDIYLLEDISLRVVRPGMSNIAFVEFNKPHSSALISAVLPDDPYMIAYISTLFFISEGDMNEVTELLEMET